MAYNLTKTFFNLFFFGRKPNLMKQNGLNCYEMYQINSKPACGHTWLEVHAIPISMLNKKSNVIRPSISKKCIKFNWNKQINSQQSFEIENFCTRRNTWWVPMGNNGSWPISSDSRSPPNWVRLYFFFFSSICIPIHPNKTKQNSNQFVFGFGLAKAKVLLGVIPLFPHN